MADKEYIERVALIKDIEVNQRNTEHHKDGRGKRIHVCEHRHFIRMVHEQPAADVVSRGVFEQIKWERDMAMQQLEEHGIPFGAKADVVAVVRCKNCDYWKDTSDDTTTEPHWGECRKPLGDYRYCETAECDFCSYGKRKEQT